MKKLFYKFTAYLVLAFTLILALGACFQKKTYVISESSTKVIITILSAQMDLTEETTLLDYMQSLKTDGQMDFDLKDGMVTSINSIENAADWSQCWMLYTSDSNNANTAWGTVEYNGTLYGSAMWGAESLKVKEGCIYIWYYQAM